MGAALATLVNSCPGFDCTGLCCCEQTARERLKRAVESTRGATGAALDSVPGPSLCVQIVQMYYMFAV